MPCIVRFVFTFACVILFAPHSVAAQYSFVNIVDERGPIGFGFTPQAVSETGTVAFVGYQGDIGGTYLGSGGAVAQVVTNLDLPAGFSGLGTWALNASGVAARLVDRCCNPRHDLIQLYEPTGMRTIGEVTGFGNIDNGFHEPTINNSGAVAYSNYTSDRTGIVPVTLTRWHNGSATTLVGAAADFHSIRAGGVNEQGDVAFVGGHYGDLGEWLGASYYRTNGTTTTYIAGPFPSAVGTPRMNDSGAIAFWALLDSGDEGIFVGDGGPLTTVAIADPTTPFYEFQDDIDINNQGTVAFTARLWDGTFGIFVGDDPVNDKVVQIGDLLFGQRVSGLGRPHLNNRGDIAFWFEVLDPRVTNGHWSGIALAVNESPLAGDFNNDSTVDAADYVAWRKGLGPTYTQDDYNIWRAHFGESAGSGAGAAIKSPHAAVPEPSMLGLVAMALLARRGARRWPSDRTSAIRYVTHHGQLTTSH